VSRLSRRLVFVALAVALIAAGCGGDTPSGRLTVAARGFLPATELQRELGNGFRHALYRVAVMSQQEGDALDLGQPLPAGLVDAVRCAPVGARPALAEWRWKCAVRWETVSGRTQRTAYDVRLTPTGCFVAAATPALPTRYDATIRTYGEDPLNAVTSVRRGC
jgi:hypothetical protein